jgi:hypothetical protein
VPLWRLIRAVWAFPGDAIGWTAMRICGIHAPTRSVVIDGVRVNFVEDPRVGRLLDHQHGQLIAQTLGRYVFSRQPVWDELRDHELEHVRQWRRFGLLFEPLYFADAGLQLIRRRRPFADNRFEVAARRKADEGSARRGS